MLYRPRSPGREFLRDSSSGADHRHGKAHRRRVQHGRLLRPARPPRPRAPVAAIAALSEDQLYVLSKLTAVLNKVRRSPRSCLGDHRTPQEAGPLRVNLRLSHVSAVRRRRGSARRYPSSRTVPSSSTTSTKRRRSGARRVDAWPARRTSTIRATTLSIIADEIGATLESVAIMHPDPDPAATRSSRPPSSRIRWSLRHSAMPEYQFGNQGRRRRLLHDAGPVPEHGSPRRPASPVRAPRRLHVADGTGEADEYGEHDGASTMSTSLAPAPPSRRNSPDGAASRWPRRRPRHRRFEAAARLPDRRSTPSAHAGRQEDRRRPETVPTRTGPSADDAAFPLTAHLHRARRILKPTIPEPVESRVTGCSTVVRPLSVRPGQSPSHASSSTDPETVRRSALARHADGIDRSATSPDGPEAPSQLGPAGPGSSDHLGVQRAPDHDRDNVAGYDLDHPVHGGYRPSHPGPRPRRTRARR